MNHSARSATARPLRHARAARGRALIGARLAAAAGMCLVAHAPAQELRATYRGLTPIPQQQVTDQNGSAVEVRGLSGIAFTGGELYVACVDNADALVRVSVVVRPDGSAASVAAVGALRLDALRDHEAAAMQRGPGSAAVLLAEEDGPGVHVHHAGDGRTLQSLPVPEVFGLRRNNFGFEALAVSRDGRTAWTANEEALRVDGPTSTQQAGTVVRLLRYDDRGAGLEPAAQFAYVTEPLHGPPVQGSRSGLVELVLLPDGRLLALERSLAFAFDGVFESRLYEIDLRPATDVSSLEALDGAAYTPVAKRLLWRGRLTNLEGLTVGPRLDATRVALVGVVDDGDPISRSAVVMIELDGVPMWRVPMALPGGGQTAPRSIRRGGGG